MELKKQVRNFLSSKIRATNDEDLTIVHSINTRDLDRHLTVVLPKGAKIENFLKNAVVLWSHNMDSNIPKVPIAKCVNLTVEEDQIEVTTKFNANDPFAVKVFNAYKDGFLNAWSIGFQPLKYVRYTEENRKELNKTYNLKIKEEQIQEAGFYGIYVVHEWELLEYSAVPVPGNPGALTKEREQELSVGLVQRGLINDKKDLNVNSFLQEPREREEEGNKLKDEKSAEELLKEAKQNEKNDSLVIKCSKCEKEFDYLKEKESKTGYVKCPNCKSEVDREGNIDETLKREEVEKELEEIKSKLSGTVNSLDFAKEIEEVKKRIKLAEDSINKRGKEETDKLKAQIKVQEVRIKELETALEQVKKIEATVMEIKESLDTDNLDAIRDLDSKDDPSSEGNGFGKWLKKRLK